MALTKERHDLISYCIGYLSNKECKEALKLLWTHFEGEAPNLHEQAKRVHPNGVNVFGKQYKGSWGNDNADESDYFD